PDRLARRLRAHARRQHPRDRPGADPPHQEDDGARAPTRAQPPARPEHRALAFDPPLAPEAAGVLDPGAEGSGVDRGKAVERGLDLAEVAPQPLGVDEPGADEGQHIAAIAGVVTLELRERLGVGVEVAKGEPLAALDERASFLPTVRERNEVA